MIEWTDTAERLPEIEGRYLVIVHWKARYNGTKKLRSAHSKIMCLEFAEGEFWLDHGAPGRNMFKAWTYVPDGWSTYIPPEHMRETLPPATPPHERG